VLFVRAHPGGIEIGPVGVFFTHAHGIDRGAGLAGLHGVVRLVRDLLFVCGVSLLRHGRSSRWSEPEGLTREDAAPPGWLTPASAVFRNARPATRPLSRA
jgi:hypothetical protein